MGYYGRIWCGGITENKDTVFYSNLLDGDDWTGGTTGYINLKTVWGTDEIIALAPFYGKLVIFGKNNIAIYNSPNGAGVAAARDEAHIDHDDLQRPHHRGVRPRGPIHDDYIQRRQVHGDFHEADGETARHQHP